MAISQYWVGQIPARPIAIDVRDGGNNSLNLNSYTNFTVHVIDPDNEAVDLTGSTLNTAGAASGRFVFRWPADRSVFEKTGDYLMQLEIDGLSTKDLTSVHTIRVRKMGGTK